VPGLVPAGRPAATREPHQPGRTGSRVVRSPRRSRGERQDDDGEQDAVNNSLPAFSHVCRSGQDGDEGRADQPAPYRAVAAEEQHQQHVDQNAEAKTLRMDGLEIAAVERAAMERTRASTKILVRRRASSMPRHAAATASLRIAFNARPAPECVSESEHQTAARQ